MLHGFFKGRHGQRFQREDGWEGRGFRGRSHQMGGRGAGRPLEHGDLRFLVLHLIADKPRYGYELIKALEEKIGGGYSPSPGVVYPTLTLLEELGYASVSTTDTAKKLYTVTAEGTAFLEANQAIVDVIKHRLAKRKASHSSGSAPQIMRATENLKMALRLRLSAGALTDAQVQAVAEILDEAVRKIEQA